MKISNDNTPRQASDLLRLFYEADTAAASADNEHERLRACQRAKQYWLALTEVMDHQGAIAIAYAADISIGPEEDSEDLANLDSSFDPKCIAFELGQRVLSDLANRLDGRVHILQPALAESPTILTDVLNGLAKDHMAAWDRLNVSFSDPETGKAQYAIGQSCFWPVEKCFSGPTNRPSLTRSGDINFEIFAEIVSYKAGILGSTRKIAYHSLIPEKQFTYKAFVNRIAKRKMDQSRLDLAVSWGAANTTKIENDEERQKKINYFKAVIDDEMLLYKLIEKAELGNRKASPQK